MFRAPPYKILPGSKRKKMLYIEADKDVAHTTIRIVANGSQQIPIGEFSTKGAGIYLLMCSVEVK